MNSSYNSEEEYQKDIKECARLMKLSHHVGSLKPADKKIALEVFFELKHIIYTLLYYKVGISPQLKRIIRLKDYIKDTLVLKDMRLVIKHVNHPRFTGKGLTLQDLIMHGFCGYLYALDRKFDPSKGYQLSTYAVPWIKQHAQRAVEYHSKVVRLPNHIYSEISKIDVVVKQFAGNNKGVSPSESEIAVLIKDRYNLDWSEEKIADLGVKKQTHLSLDGPINSEEDGYSFVDFMTNTGSDDILEEVEQSANKDYVYELLAQLDHEEQKYIIYKFGLIDLNTKRTNAEMGQIMSMSKQELARFDKAVMEKLRTIGNLERVNL